MSRRTEANFSGGGDMASVFRIARGAVLGVLCLILLSVPVFAHHAFTAEFSGETPIELKGIISKVDWINPHVYMYLDVKGAEGKVTTWVIEAGPTRHMH